MSALPEERVRQGVITYLIEQLNYPIEGIAVEKQLRALPHPKKDSPPDRRIDILCFDIKSLAPLLLIECKGVPLRENMLAQLMGYNDYVGAQLICLANEKEFLLKRWDGTPAKHLPSYDALATP